MKNNCLNLFSIAVGVMSLLLSGMVSAEATLRFSPQRVVMEGHQKSATLSLTNRGDKAAVFRVSMLDAVYANDGSVKLLEAPPPGFIISPGLSMFYPIEKHPHLLTFR